jgi:hypothetical protein
MMSSWKVACLAGLLGLVAAGCGAGSGEGSGEGNEADPSHPLWLVGSYDTPGSETGDSDHRISSGASLALNRDGTYSYQQGCSSDCVYLKGNWRLSGTLLQFTGFLDDKSLDLTGAIASHCRILPEIHGNTMWRSGEVSDCPSPAPALSAAECKVVGYYHKSFHSDSTTSSHGSSDEITLDADHFAMTRHGTTSFQCSYDYSICIDSFDDDEPRVGQWRLTADGVEINGAVEDYLASYQFNPAAGCGKTGP